MPSRRHAISLLRLATLALALFAWVAASGCSFSRSSESISKSISSPFTSSSASSQSDESKYREEVAEYAAAFVKAGGGNAESFQKGIAKLAAQHGISDWESNPDTWTQAGRGLAKTKLTETEALAYGQAWSGGDDARFELMRKAFVAAR